MRKTGQTILLKGNFIRIYFSGSEVSDLGLHCQQRMTLNFKNDYPFSPVAFSFLRNLFYSDLFKRLSGV